jgi:putative colanic acid biosynthesis UDP-glucose lipid carrier transferase
MRSTLIEPEIYQPVKMNETRQLAIRSYLDTKLVYLTFKRGMDILSALAVILLVFPWLFPILIVLIRLDSRGPVFFRQKRVGFLGKIFWCYKFRTMHVNDEADTRQASNNDPRVTGIGKFLRNTCLDELPQFINVLLGHMSVVGPRPHMLKDSQEFSSVIAYYKFRNLVRPGITGMSQVRGCRGPATSFESIFRRYQWDAYYIRNIGFTLDFRIMAATGVLIIRSLLYKGKTMPIETSVEDFQALATAAAVKKIA